MQPVVQAQFHFRAELAQGQFRQVTRIPVARLPDQEIAVVGLRGLDVAHPLGVLLVTGGQPGRRQGRTVEVVEIPGEAQAITVKLRLRQGKALPGRQRLERTRRPQHVPMHEKEIDARAVAVLARAASVTLLVPRPGLPAQAPQGVALVFVQGVPFIPRGMPELMEQTMLGRHQPGQQRRAQRRAFAGFGERLLEGDELIVEFGRAADRSRRDTRPLSVARPALPKPAQTSSRVMMNS